MKKISLLLCVASSLLLFSCNEKNTIKSESDNSDKDTKEGMLKVENGVVNPNAKMNCKGSSSVFNAMYKGGLINFTLQNTEVFWVTNETTQKNELNIWMDNVTDNGTTTNEEYHIKIILTGATNPLTPETFYFDGKDKKVTAYLLKGEDVVDTFDATTTGSVTIDGYGHSSNVVCGSIDMKSKGLSTFVGQFNEMLSSF